MSAVRSAFVTKPSVYLIYESFFVVVDILYQVGQEKSCLKLTLTSWVNPAWLSERTKTKQLFFCEVSL